MTDLAYRILSLDRRLIFLLVSVVTVAPLLYPVGPPVRVSPQVRQMYDHVEGLPAGAVLLLSFDFEPGGKPELSPMAVAFLRHAFRTDLRVIGLTLWPAGTSLAESTLAQAAREYGKERGEDYVFLGYAPGDASAVISMGQNLYAAFPTDYYGTPVAEIPLLKNIRTLRDVRYVISLSVGFPGLDTWYVYGKEKYGFELGGGSTAVSAPRFYPLLDTGQINGLLAGLRGAAEYEILLGTGGKAVAGMAAQSATHFLIISLIVLCNACYLLTRPPGGQRR